MAASLSVTSPVSEPLHRRTITGAGFTAATAYIVTATHPSGNRQRFEVTSDGSGGFTCVVVLQERGSMALEARPRTEWEGTTTAAATASLVTT